MTPRTIDLYAFCSAKGGVGKSTLALTCARLLGQSGRGCLLIDADLTGTSLADGLDLRAPVVGLAGDGHSLDLQAAPTGAHHDLSETRRLRERRHALRAAAPLGLPFFNDILLYQGGADESECRLESLLWRHKNPGDPVRYLPSSSLPQDVRQAVAWLNGHDLLRWRQRVAWLLFGALEQLPWLTDVILDLPPGLYGFGQEVLGLMAHLSQGVPFTEGFPVFPPADVAFRVAPFLVMTSDRNDLTVALESFVRLASDLPELVPVVNRLTEGMEALRSRVRAQFPALGLAERLRPIGHLGESLGRVFLDGELRMDEGVSKLMGSLEIKGS